MDMCRLKQGAATLPGTRPGPGCAATTCSIRASETRQIAMLLTLGIAALLSKSCSAIHDQTGTVLVDLHRALRPHGLDQVQPGFEFLAKLTRTGIFNASQLAYQAEIAEQRHAFLAPRCKAAV